MALTKKQQKELEIMLCDKKAAKEMIEAMTSDAAISKRTERILAIGLASKELAADVKAQIDASAGAVSKQNEEVLDIAMASKESGDALEAEIES
jgi:hypothetical protein